MKLFTIIYSDLASVDLFEIWFTIAQDNRLTADRFLRKLNGKIVDLQILPTRGSPRPDIFPDARSLIVGNYLILYRINKNAVEIVRVVHGARNLAELFQ